ncbi:hypothetical protein ACFX2I_002307 [Malus domestica]
MYVNEIVPLALAMGSCPTTFITLMGRVHCLGMHFLLKVASESAAALAYMHSSVDSLKPIMLHGVAELAESCIKLSSAERPAMEEAAIELRRLCGGTHYPKPVSSRRQLLSENPL